MGCVFQAGESILCLRAARLQKQDCSSDVLPRKPNLPASSNTAIFVGETTGALVAANWPAQGLELYVHGPNLPLIPWDIVHGHVVLVTE